MKALFGAVSLLVVLAVVGMIATRQLKAVAPAAASPSASEAAPTTVHERSIQIQEKVRSDVNRALEQGARKDENDK